MSCSAISTSRSAGSRRMSPSRFFVKTTLPAPMNAILRHPLFAPSVRPLMNCRCSSAKTSDRRQRDQDRRRRDQVVVGEVGALQVRQRRGDRPLVAGAHQHDRPEEVVVDPGELERRERGQRRLAQRQDDPEELARDAGAVDPRRLAERRRDRLHVVRQHERAEARLERDVDRRSGRGSESYISPLPEIHVGRWMRRYSS